MIASYIQTITETDVKAFAGVTEEHNLVNFREDYAQSSRFKDGVSYGLLTASFYVIFGTKLPGEVCIYRSECTI